MTGSQKHFVRIHRIQLLLAHVAQRLVKLGRVGYAGVCLCCGLLIAVGWYLAPKRTTFASARYIQAEYRGLDLFYDNAWYGRQYYRLIHHLDDDTYAVVEFHQEGLNRYTSYHKGREVKRGSCEVVLASDCWMEGVTEAPQFPLSMLKKEDFGL